jgi:hypothetical protein
MFGAIRSHGKALVCRVIVRSKFRLQVSDIAQSALSIASRGCATGHKDGETSIAVPLKRNRL